MRISITHVIAMVTTIEARMKAKDPRGIENRRGERARGDLPEQAFDAGGEVGDSIVPDGSPCIPRK
jgi:hypothetical protein